MTRSPWHHDSRIRLSEQQAAKLFLERHGCCRECGRKLGPSDDWIVEHIIALECGGTNDWDNLGITCMWCKPSKDASDHAQAGKQRRSATKHLLSRSMKRKRGWNTKWKLKFDGTRVPRDES
ncbi:MAG: HNH endonuclease [Rhizobiales bacterium]|nr:HNH endonuclease [Hyphomicrobiales bacterium]